MPTLYASGFRITSPAIRGRLPSTPTWVRPIDGHWSGSVRIDFDRVSGGRIAYEYCFAITDDLDGVPEWEENIHTQSSRKNLIDGFVPRSVLHIRVRAVNANGVSEWTPPVKHIVR